MVWDYKNQLQPQRDQQNAELERSIADRPFAMQKITITASDFATANSGAPLEIRIPFRSVFVSAATDSTVKVKLALHEASTLQLDNALILGQRDAMKFPSMIARAFLYWDAQVGKSLDLYFFTDGEFSSGSMISNTNGGVSISEGSSITSLTPASITTTPAVCLAQDVTRNTAILQNRGAVSVYVGGPEVDSPSGTHIGIELVPMATYIHKNTGALWACTQSSTATLSIVVER